MIYMVKCMEINRKEFGKRIATRRKSLGMNQDVLADKLNISNNHLSSIECGHAVPSIDLFCKICEALNVTPDYLLLGDMRSNNVPQDIMDLLRLCTDEQISFVLKIVQLMLESHFEEKPNDKYEQM